MRKGGWGRVALNLTWLLPIKTPMERSFLVQKNPSKGLRCNSYTRMLGKQFALSPVFPLFKCLHRLTSIRKLTLAHATKKILLVFSVTPFKQIKIKIKTVQQIKSRIWEMKGGTYTKTLAKIQVRGIICIRDIRGNVLPKFIEVCMETPCRCSLDELEHGGRKPTKTSVTEVCYKCVNLLFEKLIIKH